MEEIKKFEILPDDVERVIQERANFGWTYVSSQEIYNTTSTFKRRLFTINNEIIEVNYVNLILRRDTEMNNYLEIKKLEQKYYSLVVSYPGNGDIPLTVCLFLGIPASIFSLMAFLDGSVYFGLCGLLIGCFLILIGILSKINAMKKYNEAKRKAEKAEEEKASLMSQARNLLSK